MELEQNYIKKKNTKPKKTKDTIENKKTFKNDEIDNWVTRQGEVYQNVIKTYPKAGYYKVGKSFNIYFENKPNIMHRYFSKIFLGWTWVNN